MWGDFASAGVCLEFVVPAYINEEKKIWVKVGYNSKKNHNTHKSLNATNFMKNNYTCCSSPSQVGCTLKKVNKKKRSGSFISGIREVPLKFLEK